MNFLWPYFFLTIFIIFHLLSFDISAVEKPVKEDPEEITSFNPRDDYRFGVGTMVGGPFGILGIIADMNWESLINAELGVGSGIYFDSYSIHGRYLILDDPLTPYVGAGLAYWDGVTNGPKMAHNSEPAVKLGLVQEDGTNLRGGILLLPLSFGLHYMSDQGLSLFGDFEFIISPSHGSAIPYGGLGFQWYF